VTPDCVLFLPNPQRPPKDDELPAALAEVLQKWLIAEPGFRVRDTLSEMFHPHWHKPARF
jgi:hypothetical protein